MELPIPDDWDGERWACFQVNWPDSDKWLAILAGLLLMPARGRLWDGRTGSIRDTQAIGRQIDVANFPLITCDGAQSEEPTGGSLGLVLSAIEEEVLMSLCGYNPKAFKIEGGVFYVRDFCGEWVAIGGIGADQPEVLPDTPDIDDPPEELSGALACTKALRIATLCYDIVQAGFASGGLGLDFIWGWADFADYVRSQFSGINFGDADLYNMFYYVVAVEVAGLESETENQDLIQYLACAWEPFLSDGPDGITASEYSQLKTVLTSVMKTQIGDSAYQGFGKSMRFIWELALSSIGTNDIAKYTRNLVSTGLEDCSCPEEEDPLTIPNEDGWYLSEWFEHTIGPLGANNDNLPIGICQTLNHDSFGSLVVAYWTGSNGTLKRMADAKTFLCPSAGYNMHSNTSDAWGSPPQGQIRVMGATQAVWTQLFPLQNFQKFDAGHAWGQQDNPASPVIAAGESHANGFYWNSDTGDTRTIRMRFLHNINSPSG